MGQQKGSAGTIPPISKFDMFLIVANFDKLTGHRPLQKAKKEIKDGEDAD